jgi:hypothetical protein
LAVSLFSNTNPERHCPRHVDIVDELWLVRGKAGHKVKYGGDILHLRQLVIAELLVSIESCFESSTNAILNRVAGFVQSVKFP